MTIPFWCLLVAILMPYVLAGVGGYFRQKQFGGIDNKYPRLQKAQLEGAGARAAGAEQNAFETLPVFATAVLVSHLAGADPARAALFSEIFVATRVLHAIFYLANIDALRSLSFLLGFACCVALFVISA
jgi:uncharacterized MAPEG superfamily protein